MLFPSSVIWEVSLMNAISIFYNHWKAPNHILRLRGTTRDLAYNRSSAYQTYASQMRIEQINPNTVQSASVGSAFPRIQNGPLPLDLFFDSANMSLILCHISCLK